MSIDHADLRAQKQSNRFQSALLMLGMTAIMAGIGGLLLGRFGVFVALGICAASAILGPRVSPAMVIRLYKGQLIDPRRSPDLYEVAIELARRAKLPDVPDLYYIPTRMLNAFAVGTEANAGVALTDGLIRALSPRELVGVLAHEISHIRHHDTRVMGVADVVARITGTLSQIGQVLLLLQIPAVLMGKSVGLSFLQILALVFAPVATNLLQLALSRQREFHADAGAIELTGDPEGLASALRKLEQHHGGNWLQKLLFPQRRAPDPAILRTHPAMVERIERLTDLIPQVAPPAMSAVEESNAQNLCDACGPHFARRPRWHASGLWY